MQTNNGTTSPTSSGIRPFLQQIAGHKSNGKEVYGCLETDDDCILKPLQSGSRGPREKKLYESLSQSQSDDDDIVQTLRSFLPKYYGSVVLNGIEYLKLQDLTKPFSHPCGIDIKVGARTWDPEADGDKIRREKEKYPPAEIIGYQILGMRVISPDNGIDVVRDKTYGRSLDAANVLEGLRLFLSGAGDRQSVVAHQIVQQLKSLQSWFERQKCYAFYATSILIIYEGSSTCPSSQNTEAPSPNSRETLADVRMIDFAHWFEAECRDENFLHGLEHVIDHFTQLI